MHAYILTWLEICNSGGRHLNAFMVNSRWTGTVQWKHPVNDPQEGLRAVTNLQIEGCDVELSGARVRFKVLSEDLLEHRQHLGGEEEVFNMLECISLLSGRNILPPYCNFLCVFINLNNLIILQYHTKVSKVADVKAWNMLRSDEFWNCKSATFPQVILVVRS